MAELDFANAAGVIVLMTEMRSAADAASKAWLEKALQCGPKYSVHDGDLLTGKPVGPAIGTMLDVCGCAWIEFTDKRSKLYRAFKSTGYVSPSGNNISLSYSLSGRQEMGLHEAAIVAAQKVLTDRGIKGTRIHSYID